MKHRLVFRVLALSLFIMLILPAVSATGSWGKVTPIAGMSEISFCSDLPVLSRAFTMARIRDFPLSFEGLRSLPAGGKEADGRCFSQARIAIIGVIGRDGFVAPGIETPVIFSIPGIAGGHLPFVFMG